MRDHRAAILGGRVLVVHPTVPLHPVALHRDQRVQIAIVVAKICLLVEVHQIALVQRAKFRKVVKPLIHAGFAPSR